MRLSASPTRSAKPSTPSALDRTTFLGSGRFALRDRLARQLQRRQRHAVAQLAFPNHRFDLGRSELANLDVLGLFELLLAQY